MAISSYPFRLNTRRVHGFRVVSHLMVSILYTDGERPSEAAVGGVEGSLTSGMKGDALCRSLPYPAER
jgi:hypothetical protein